MTVSYRWALGYGASPQKGCLSSFPHWVGSAQHHPLHTSGTQLCVTPGHWEGALLSETSSARLKLFSVVLCCVPAVFWSVWTADRLSYGEKLLRDKPYLSVSLVTSPKALEDEGETAAAIPQDLVVTVRSLCWETLVFFLWNWRTGLGVCSCLCLNVLMGKLRDPSVRTWLVRVRSDKISGRHV